jgi:peptide-methionine (S)-S-oxide reductase
MKTEKAIFAAGCFWGIQAAFDQVKGVVKTTAGYTGGTTEKPAYEDVCSGETGHAEAVLVEFDPKTVNFEQLLDLFWDIHDPTQFNRQGPDVGTQYRSAIFYYNDKQKETAEKSLKKHQYKTKKKISTQIVHAGEFYPAEDYHQKYYKKHKVVACASGILKKLMK